MICCKCNAQARAKFYTSGKDFLVPLSQMTGERPWSHQSINSGIMSYMKAKTSSWKQTHKWHLQIRVCLSAHNQRFVWRDQNGL